MCSVVASIARSYAATSLRRHYLKTSTCTTTRPSHAGVFNDRKASTDSKMGLSEKTVEVLKASVPLLEKSGLEITGRMYTRMVAGHPELRDQFNMSHLRHVTSNNVGPESSLQAIALAQAVLAYAKNADNLGALGPAIEDMAEKHVAINVRPEQYKVVGENLLGSLKTQLGDDASDEILDAWKEAYDFLAEVLIKREDQLYGERAEAKGGWVGYKKYTLFKKITESDSVTSFYMKPADEGPVAGFCPGQYVVVRIPQGTAGCPASAEHALVRNYSLSCGPGKEHLRISVKKEGVVSDYLHEHLQVGDLVEISVPCGTFRLNPESIRDKHAVFISAGVGITPLMSMLESAVSAGVDGNRITFVQCCKGPSEHPMKEAVDRMAAQNDVRSFAFYSAHDPDGSLKETRVLKGRMTAKRLESEVMDADKADTEFYFCGPRMFMLAVRKMLGEEMGVDADRIHFEFFGPSPEF